MKNLAYLFRGISIRLPLECFDIVQTELLRTHSLLSRPLRILDLGAGSAHYWANPKIYQFLQNTSSKLTLVDASADIALDPRLDMENIDSIIGILPKALKAMKEDSYDVVVCLDLIEHLSKESGYKLLYEIDRICQFTSVIYTPNGFVWQPPSANNEFNAHISSWLPKELKKLGWHIQRGHVGLRFLIGPYAIPKKQANSHIFLELLALARISCFRLPNSSFAFSAVKRAKSPRIVQQN